MSGSATYLNVSDSFLFKMCYSNSCIIHLWEYPPPYFFSSNITFFAELESSVKNEEFV